MTITNFIREVPRSPTKAADAPKVNPRQTAVYNHIAKYAKASLPTALFKLALSFAVYGLLFWINSLWLCVFMGLTLDRLFVQFHDMAHGSFFPSQKMNRLVGTAMGAIVYNPYGYWKFHHDYHHQHSNDLDFLQTSQTSPLTLAQYKKLSPTMQRVYTFFTSRPMMLLCTPSLVWAFFITRCRVRDLMYFVPATLFIVLTGRTMLITLGVCVGSTFGTYLFHTQHTFEGASRVHGKDYFENGLHGSSMMIIPRWLKFFTCGIEYHHIHHLNAKVPSYRIQQCHEEAGDLFNDIVVLPFSGGLDSLKYNVWDTQNRCFVHAYPGMP